MLLFLARHSDSGTYAFARVQYSLFARRGESQNCINLRTKWLSGVAEVTVIAGELAPRSGEISAHRRSVLGHERRLPHPDVFFSLISLPPSSQV